MVLLNRRREILLDLNILAISTKSPKMPTTTGGNSMSWELRQQITKVDYWYPVDLMLPRAVEMESLKLPLALGRLSKVLAIKDHNWRKRLSDCKGWDVGVLEMSVDERSILTISR